MTIAKAFWQTTSPAPALRDFHLWPEGSVAASEVCRHGGTLTLSLAYAFTGKVPCLGFIPV